MEERPQFGFANSLFLDSESIGIGTRSESIDMAQRKTDESDSNIYFPNLRLVVP